MFETPESDLATLALTLLSVAAIIMGIENVALVRHYGRGRIFDARFSFRFSFGRSVRPVADTMFSPLAFVAVSVVVVVASLAFMFGSLAPFVLACILCGFFLYAQLARPYGNCGADQMANILAILLALYFTPGAEPLQQTAVLGFATVQISLAYLTTGVAKLSSKEWRNGIGFNGVMHSYVYGRSPLTALMDTWAPSYAWASWFIIVSQILTALGMLYGGWPMLLAFAGGAIFHVAVAVFMRLNLFPWTFLGMYPLAAAFHARGGYPALAQDFAALF